MSHKSFYFIFNQKKRKAENIQKMINQNRDLFNDFPKAKTAKIIKNLIEMVALIEGTLDM